jgi:ABC-type multidrug transport system permease subunit
MKRILGMGVGVLYLGLSFGALQRANGGWATNYNDIGFWWTVIAVILAMAAIGALVGTWIHTQETSATHH